MPKGQAHVVEISNNAREDLGGDYPILAALFHALLVCCQVLENFFSIWAVGIILYVVGLKMPFCCDY